MTTESDTPRKPNILFVFTDDQRFDTIAALGNPEIDTPNMDRLVAAGTTFTHAHIMGGTAGAICMPSRAMLMTGRTLFSLEGNGNRIPPEHTAMPEHFRANGYATAHIGKWHQDKASHARCFSDGAKIFGFARHKGWYEACNGHWHIPVHDYDPTGTYDRELGYCDPPIEPFQAPFEQCKEQGRHSAEVFSDAAIEFITNHPESEAGKDGKPFFLYLAHIAPHDPRQYPTRLRERYNLDTVSLPENFRPRHPFDNGDCNTCRDELLAEFPRRSDSIKQHQADYYGIIHHVDEHLGRILDALEASGQADNTIILFAGDNGLAVGQHGLMGKQSMYDHSVRVPLIMAGPGIPAGKRTDALCYLLDIFPTLCEMTDQDIPATVEGQSLLPVIEGKTDSARNVLHFAYRQWQRAVRKDNWKLIEYCVNGERHTQLFDLETDPLEMNSRADDPACADRLEALRKELGAWRRDLHDTRPEHGQVFWKTYDG
jgi:arylsulfatase A-like enzyme